MNMMSKILCSLFIFSVFAFSLQAQTKNKGIVVKKDGSKASYDDIKADSKGVLIVKKGKVGRKINPKDYLYAKIAPPADLKKAISDLNARKYGDAADAFKKLFDKYKFVGYDMYCASRGGLAYKEAGKTRDAVGLLEKMGDKFPVDPSKTNYFLSGKKLLAELYAEQKKYSSATKTLKILASSNDDSFAPFANNLRGKMLLDQGKKKDAKLMYMRTALLYGKSNTKERPEALKIIIGMLKAEKNNKALDFEKMLKNDYQ